MCAHKRMQYHISPIPHCHRKHIRLNKMDGKRRCAMKSQYQYMIYIYIYMYICFFELIYKPLPIGSVYELTILKA